MKKGKSVFHKLIEPINSRAIGSIISRQEILQETGLKGGYTLDITRNLLSNAGFLSPPIKGFRGNYRILQHIPTFLTSELFNKLHYETFWFSGSSRTGFYKRKLEEKTREYPKLIDLIWIRLKKFINEKQIGDKFNLVDLKEFFEVSGPRTRIVRLFLHGLLLKKILHFHGPDNYVIKAKIDSELNGKIFLQCIYLNDWKSWFIKVKE